jgi:hypothetical protein
LNYFFGEIFGDFRVSHISASMGGGIKVVVLEFYEEECEKKEANNIEYEHLNGGNVQVFRNKEKEQQKIVEMRQCDAERLGLIENHFCGSKRGFEKISVLI